MKVDERRVTLGFDYARVGISDEEGFQTDSDDSTSASDTYIKSDTAFEDEE